MNPENIQRFIYDQNHNSSCKNLAESSQKGAVIVCPMNEKMYSFQEGRWTELKIIYDEKDSEWGSHGHIFKWDFQEESPFDELLLEISTIINQNHPLYIIPMEDMYYEITNDYLIVKHREEYCKINYNEGLLETQSIWLPFEPVLNIKTGIALPRIEENGWNLPDLDGQLPNLIYDDEYNVNNVNIKNTMSVLDNKDNIQEETLDGWDSYEPKVAWGELVDPPKDEYRYDEMNKKWYTKSEYYNYYGDYYMWEMMSNRRRQQRQLIIDCYMWAHTNIPKGLQGDFIEDMLKTYA